MRTLPALGLLFGLLACGGRGEAPELEPQRDLPELGPARAAVPGTIGRRCAYVSGIDALPPLRTIARPGTRGNMALASRDMQPSDSVELSVRYDTEGRLAWVRAIRSNLPGSRTVPLEQALLGSLQEEGPADWGVRVLMVDGDIAALEPSVVCPAEPQRQQQGQRAVGWPRTASALAAFNRVRGRRFPVLISLDERGRILDVRLGQRSGYTQVDQFLIDWVRATDFHPRLHDGIPIPAVIRQTLRIPTRW